MTRDEFKAIIRKVRLAYPREKFVDGKEAFDVWYGYFEDMNLKNTLKAVDEYVKAERFPPTIADIRGIYNEIETEEKDFREMIMQDYRYLTHYFKPDNRSKAEFERLVFSDDDRTKTVQRSRWLADAGKREYDNGNIEITLYDFLKGIK